MITKLLEEGNAILAEKGMGQGGAETGSSAKITRAYLDSLTIEMRVIDAVEASTEMTLFGETFKTPAMVAALSSLGALGKDAMAQVARGAKAAGAAMWLGVGTHEELESVVAAGAKTIKIVKPYRDQNLIFEKIEQAEKAGVFALGMDTCFGFGGKRGDKRTRVEQMRPQTLAEVKSYVQATKLPFVIKGILSERDAEKALEAGAAALVVSHHGGGMVDYALPPLRVLPRIVKLAGDVPVIADCGMLRGTDVFKALALGARGVLVGRAVLAGLAAAGPEGVQGILEGMTDELQRTMCLTSSPDIAHIDPSVIWH